MVTIELPESVVAALTAQAEAHGLRLNEYLERMARSETAATSRRSVEEFDRELDELSLDVPPLPADFSRADMYQDHD